MRAFVVPATRRRRKLLGAMYCYSSWILVGFCWCGFLLLSEERTITLALAFSKSKRLSFRSQRYFQLSATPPLVVTMPTPQRSWRVWRSVEKLEEIAEAMVSQTEKTTIETDVSSILARSLKPATPSLVQKLAEVVRNLAIQHEGDPKWRGLLDRSKLWHEIEESVLAIHFLEEALASQQVAKRDVILVDVCSGKGVFSLLASRYFAEHCEDDKIRIRKIILLDKDPHLNWNHIAHDKDTESQPSKLPAMEGWPRCNLHEMDDIVHRLEDELQNNNACLALVGIHLCRTLSPTCIGIANRLGPTQCPHLVLAPCCLPRIALKGKKQNANNSHHVLNVFQYETPLERQQRLEAQERRKAARLRGRANGACWNCGEIGHTKDECPFPRLKLLQPPNMNLDVSTIWNKDDTHKETTGPFGSYCHLLATSIQRSDVTVLETGLTNSHGASQSSPSNQRATANNWNKDRKSIYIVASS